MSLVFNVYVKFIDSKDEIFLKSCNYEDEACDYAKKFLFFNWLHGSLDVIEYVRIMPVEVDEE